MSDVPSSKTTSDTQPRKKKMIENISSLFFSLLLVFAVRSSIIEAFKIPSGSMIPTLLVGDYIFVNKFAFGLHFPFAEWISDEPVTLIHRDGPKHGDIIVFKYPKNPSIYFIKRVIGVAGDKIELREKVLYINDHEMTQTQLPSDEEAKILKDVDESRTHGASLKVYTENLDGVKHWIMLDQSGQNNIGVTSNFGPVIVPADSLFCMGDNRDFSNDSRFWGFVPMRNVKGKALFIWMSLWMDFGESQYYFRPLRTGTILR
jgi:signal peptidase I